MTAYNVTLERSQHLTIGIYLIGSGFVSGVLNLLGIVIFAVYPGILVNPSALPELALLLADLCIAGLHPFSGTSALLNRWVWGPVGCQLYSASGFLFGNFQMFVIPLIAFDRYVLCCESHWSKYRSYRNYAKAIVGLFCCSLFWAVTPLMGWASYDLLPQQISCSLDWTRSDTSYVSYNTALTLVVTLGPMGIAGLLYWAIYAHHRAHPDNSPRITWARKNSVGLIILGSWLTTYIGYSGFCVTCFWPYIADPRTIPTAINILPPLMAKTAGIINPLFYTFGNPVHFFCLKKMFGKGARSLEEMAEEEAARGGEEGQKMLEGDDAGVYGASLKPDGQK